MTLPEEMGVRYIVRSRCIIESSVFLIIAVETSSSTYIKGRLIGRVENALQYYQPLDLGELRLQINVHAMRILF